MAWPHRDDQCPERGPLLSHITKRGSVECKYCGAALRTGKRDSEDESPTPPRESVMFTERQIQYYDFLHWAWLQDLA